MQDMVLLRQVGLPSLHPSFITFWFLIFLFFFSLSLHSCFLLCFLRFPSLICFILILLAFLISSLWPSLLYIAYPTNPIFHPSFCCHLCSFLIPESGHLVDHQSDLESVHGGLPALLAPEETQQEDDPQSPEEKNSGGQRASSGRADPAGGRHEHVPGRCTRSTQFYDFAIQAYIQYTRLHVCLSPSLRVHLMTTWSCSCCLVTSVCSPASTLWLPSWWCWTTSPRFTLMPSRCVVCSNDPSLTRQQT